jgi:hypothetical protein
VKHVFSTCLLPSTRHVQGPLNGLYQRLLLRIAAYPGLGVSKANANKAEVVKENERIVGTLVSWKVNAPFQGCRFFKRSLDLKSRFH